MFSKVVQYEIKIKKVLSGVFEGKCASVQTLTHYFRQLDERKTDSGFITLPLFSEWITQAVLTWNTNSVTPPTDVSLFTLNLAILLAKKEFLFGDLNSVFIELITIFKQPDVEPSVKLAYVKLLSSFLEHKPGLEFIIKNDFCEEILRMCLSDESTKVREESTKLVSIVLEKTLDRDDFFCEIVKRVLSPLKVNIYDCLKDSNGEVLEPSLKLLAGILEHILVRVVNDGNNIRIALRFLECLRLEELIDDLTLLSQAFYRSISLVKVTFMIQFLELYLRVRNKSVTCDVIKSSVYTMIENFAACCSKGNFGDIMELASFGYPYWSLVESKIGISNNQNYYSFPDHVLCLLLVPCASLLLKNFMSFEQWETTNVADDFRDVTFYNFFKSLDPNLLRIGYTWRNSLVFDPNLTKICIESVIRTKKLKSLFTKTSAIIVFQLHVYIFQDIVSTIKANPEKLESLRHETYFVEVLALVADLTEQFHITWRDDSEVLSLVSLAFDFLNLHRWPTGEVVQALRLINIAIKNYMSSKMLLLVDLGSDSAVSHLGPLLSELLSGKDVKGAALEVTHTMANMSAKFPSLQKVLMDSELPTLVVKMSTCDSESFVRATAIKCLQEMIQVEEIWNNALKSEDLPQKMRDVLLNETEGIVRVEAATFMCVAYENQQFPKDTLDRVYETMIYASTTDLHWEVKVRALDFWDKVIKNHLQNQGMIDGSFPNVTFSKEHRKIVTLTDSEIRKRLLKVLSQLSSIGCLGVLMSAIKDDCDMEVSKTAAKITQRLVELFKKYNVRSDGSTPTSPLPTENGMSTASVSSGISVDESMDSPSNHHELNEDIIDQIVNSKDVCLLRNVYAPSEYSSVSNYDIQVRRVVTPNEFLQFTQQDLNTIISEKKNWLNGIEDLGSLLDDMLKTYEDDVNNMDCY
ncbi:uncharacterized protein LOC100141760 isoform X12 [Tribolium castaneum]|uniref:uncharacterized protein LOC100141760 isoform X12 n=1 Tax=Tribolium castaneum TaxID=7070 RepID=UPI00046C2AFB|nr:PREDICTED: uncharacterized protein LOC100141760 isoform X12 [Tribolium castaneum]|eukprot:XP_008197120.1 PREDICTED: uncharacterized protein LOC100141760 isoform X12 [Tribolium castaneum]